MECLADLFSLQPGEAYLNGASRSPQLKAAADAARAALRWREENSGMPIEAFFGPVEQLRRSFSKLINGEDPDRVALIPAASYGIATAAKNLPLRRGQHIIVVQDQFPSNYYAWHRLCADAGATLRTIARPDGSGTWSERVLEAIDENTAAVAIAQLHWSDGTVFDLEAIRERTDAFGAWLIVDGTQSIGAYPFDVQRIRPDALIAGGYKWLLGPYGCGYAYYGPRMDDGIPLEENWINRAGSHDFTRLADYQHAYRPLAARYSVGEHSNFIAVPMQQAGLDLLNRYGPSALQAYTRNLWDSIGGELGELDIELSGDRAHHLIGLRLPSSVNMASLKQELERRDVSVSYRGDLVRVSPSWYNRPEEMHRLAEALRAAGGRS
ncbi:aminotransferase class V-fold PLP-dependent enzyme [Neolewinella litorea]|uniref:Aminotransferase class V-fold PLP-dependent enzyme n=1 Tax=Neolewinella litorea TaxID=2562452 RepID=A0A4S4NXL8_9BACT|nr:aminotransferase class V-fold PLP-dependent enzyme [Neolewinella litorea]THH41020.1 aminotransferase class V-fold PLP-dependent enzyme [Neolewinella litorea]